MASPLSIGFNLPFSEAIAAAVKRGVVLPDVYYGELQGIARQLAFTVSGLAGLEQIQQVKDSLDKALESGQSFNAWKKSVAALGLDLPKHRLDNIYRTNLQGQYMAGKWEQFERNKANRPYLMYDAINDSRVRPAHLALDGIIRPLDDPLWRTHSAPNGYRCRCSLISLTEAQAQARSNGDKGLNKQAVLPDGVTPAEPDKGWDYSPRERLAGVNRAIDGRQGKASEMLLSTLKDQITAFNNPMHYINIKGFDDAAKVVNLLANKYPEWFPSGLDGIYAVKDKRFFAAYSERNLYFSDYPDSVTGFKAATELMSALSAIAEAKPLTYNHEYSIETLYHEIIHSKNQHEIDINGHGVRVVEAIVQRVARNGYPVVLQAFGVAPAHQRAIINNGYGYYYAVSNLNWLFERLGINDLSGFEKAVNQQKFSGIYNDSVNIMSELSDIEVDSIKKILTYIRLENSGDFRAKVENVMLYRSKKP